MFFSSLFLPKNEFVLSCCFTYLEESAGIHGVLYHQRTVLLIATKEIHVICSTYIVVLYKVCLNHSCVSVNHHHHHRHL